MVRREEAKWGLEYLGVYVHTNSYKRVNFYFYEARFFDDVSRGSVSYYEIDANNKQKSTVFAS